MYRGTRDVLAPLHVALRGANYYKRCSDGVLEAQITACSLA